MEDQNERDVIYIREGDQPLPLYPQIIHGVKIYTPTEEKTRELEERFRRMCPLPDPEFTLHQRRERLTDFVVTTVLTFSCLLVVGIIIVVWLTS